MVNFKVASYANKGILDDVHSNVWKLVGMQWLQIEARDILLGLLIVFKKCLARFIL